MTARVRCAACDRPLGKRGRPCVRGCGARLCTARHLPPCNDLHAGQCARLNPPEEP
ncbi:hypothetical protein [Streptomyces albogriseolus]|uniref:hypothetical protein n=1 Tax=Streptomyces albogriseolus TaxID=1887 RepID=UPI00345FAB45